jgi:hypothetical protein
MTVTISGEFSHFVVARADRERVPAGVLGGAVLLEGLVLVAALEAIYRKIDSTTMTDSQIDLAVSGSYPVADLNELSRRTGLSEGYLKSLTQAGRIPGRVINPSNKDPCEFLRSTALGWSRSGEMKKLLDSDLMHQSKKR